MTPNKKPIVFTNKQIVAKGRAPGAPKLMPAAPVAKPAPAQPLLAVKPDILLDTVCAGMQELCVLLEQEMAFIKKRDIDGIKGLMKRKNQLVQDYAINMKAVAAAGDAIQAAPADKRKATKKLAEQLDVISKKNATMLNTAIMGTRSIIENIIVSIRQDAMPRSGYNHLSDRRAAPAPDECPAIIINQTA